MNILVTGGAGFIGSHLSAALSAQNIKVSVLDNLSTGKRQRLKDTIEFYQGDLRDRDFVSSVIAKEQPEIIYHLAAQASVQASIKDPVGDAQTNIVGTINLLDLAVKNGVKKVVFASSAAIYGVPRYLPIDEIHPVEMISAYAVSKFSVEHYLAFYKYLYGLDYTVLRYANVYGPGQSAGTEGGVVAIFMQHILEDKSPVIFGDGEQTRDFVFVQDVVAANLAAMTLGTGKVVNISTGNSTTVNTVYKLLQEISEKTLPPIYAHARAGDIRHSVLDNNLAGQVLAWKASFSLENGLRESVNQWNLSDS